MPLRRFNARPSWAVLLLAPLVGCGASEAARAPSDVAMHGMAHPADYGASAVPMSEAPGMDMQAPVGRMDGPAAPGAPPNPSLPTSPAGSPPSAAASPAPPRGAKEVSTSKGEAEQMIIFTASLDLELPLDSFAATFHEVIDIAVGHGGYIGEQTDESVTVRVPSARFRTALREIEKLGEVLHRSVRAEDVSEQFHDVDVRLKNLLATRKRIEGFLDRAKDINEVLRIEQELSRLNAEIDRLQGRLRYLAAQAAYSTLTVRLSAKAKPVVVADPKDAPPPPPPPRGVSLPIDWLGEVSLDGLLRLGK